MLRFANPENDTMDDIMLSPFFRVAEVINRAAEHGCLSVLGLDFVGIEPPPPVCQRRTLSLLLPVWMVCWTFLFP